MSFPKMSPFVLTGLTVWPLEGVKFDQFFNHFLSAFFCLILKNSLNCTIFGKFLYVNG